MTKKLYTYEIQSEAMIYATVRAEDEGAMWERLNAILGGTFGDALRVVPQVRLRKGEEAGVTWGAGESDIVGGDGPRDDQWEGDDEPDGVATVPGFGSIRL